jgi:hypothetical protein
MLCNLSMTPVTARVTMAVIVSAVAIGAIMLVNSRYHGSFWIGVLLIVVPVLALSFSLPHLLPVRCPKCGDRMRFRFSNRTGEGSQVYSYVCGRCSHRHDWEGSDSGSFLG